MTDLFSLEGKNAIITGGSRGLGREMALAFAERGANIVIASRKVENCETVANEVRALGRRALAIGYHAASWSDAEMLATNWGKEISSIPFGILKFVFSGIFVAVAIVQLITIY